MILRTLFGVLVVVVAAFASNARCEEEGSSVADSAVIDSVLALDYEHFDQDMNNGWRAWQRASDYAGAARLIDSYVRRHDELEIYQVIVLRFHTGQVLGFAGDYDQAIGHFQQAIDSIGVMVDWNPYVEATIAFLRHDTTRVSELRDSLLAESGRRGKRYPNLHVVNAFATYPESTYVWTYRKALEK